jgi:hypothetical protein
MAHLDPQQLHVEHVCTMAVPRRLSQEFLESHNQALPESIFPDLRVLTADRATRNKTFYPEASLRGSTAKGSGLISFVRPYAVPIIRDHNTGGGMFGGESSEVYGRVFKPASFVKDLGEGYIRAIPKITHPEAIEAVLTGRWLTVSLGSRCESVKCSICQQELTEEFCDHEKGKLYEVGEGKKAKKEPALWVIGPIYAKEISFVITPSDERAGVLNPDTSLKESAGSGSLARMLVGNRHGAFDLMTGVRLQESALPQELLPTSQRANFYFRGWGT